MRLRALATAAAIALTALPAYAHFGVLMPGSELVNRPNSRSRSATRWNRTA